MIEKSAVEDRWIKANEYAEKFVERYEQRGKLTVAESVDILKRLPIVVIELAFRWREGKDFKKYCQRRFRQEHSDVIKKRNRQLAKPKPKKKRKRKGEVSEPKPGKKDQKKDKENIKFESLKTAHESRIVHRNSLPPDLDHIIEPQQVCLDGLSSFRKRLLRASVNCLGDSDWLNIGNSDYEEQYLPTIEEIACSVQKPVWYVESELKAAREELLRLNRSRLPDWLNEEGRSQFAV